MPNKLGKFIEARRKYLGLSYRQLNDLTGISHSHISSIEKGIEPKTKKPVRPSVETLEKLAKGLNMDAKELIALSMENPSKFFQITTPVELIEKFQRLAVYYKVAENAADKKIPPETLQKFIDILENEKK